MGEHIRVTGVAFSNATYDILKFIAQILLPAVGVLYFAVAEIWGLPKAQEVVGTITAVDLFLGTLLGLSSRAYTEPEPPEPEYAGDFVLEDRGDDHKAFVLELNEDAAILDGRTELRFKLKRNDE